MLSTPATGIAASVIRRAQTEGITSGNKSNPDYRYRCTKHNESLPIVQISDI